MDIDSPPAAVPDVPSGHTHLSLPSFSSSFPLPFRVLFLVGLAQLLWATNLHILHLLGLDTAWILDIRDTDHEPPLPTSALELDSLAPASALEPSSPVRTHSPASAGRPDSGKLYQPVYKLFLLYTACVGGGWVVFRLATGADLQAMERWRWLVGIIVLGATVGAVAPWKGLGERERMAMRKAIKRILLPPSNSPIFFCDVILADILTSFAKVLGDLWISACQIWNGGITQGRVSQTGWANYITLAMVSLPYMVRLRQCLLEAHQSGWSNTRPIANALKYFSAFPVILLSAAQKNVVKEVAEAKGLTVADLARQGNRWYGEHRLFRLWLLAVIFNSMYSFWWDIEMDWGMALCEPDTWFSLRRDGPGTPGGRPGRRGSDLTLLGRFRRYFASRRAPSISHQRSPCPTPSPSFSSHSRSTSSPMTPAPASGFFAFGLRQTLLLPDPLVYHLFAIIDLVLRLTWSLKLSSHLHTISTIESGVFMMEALELMRRWMWVFIRVEWEAVKMGEARNWARPRSHTAGGQEGTVIWDEKENRP